MDIQREKVKRNFLIRKTPLPHLLLPSKKKLHGWWPGKRECTGERLLINPYNGCSVDCFFCYTRAFPGYFNLWHKEKIITVSKDFPQEVARQIDSLKVASCGYLSPVTEPFQRIEEKYHYSEKIIQIFVERNLPIEFVTKCKVPEKVLDLISSQPHSFGQVSILTLKEELRKLLSPGGADTDTLLKNIERMRRKNIYSVARIDPILPFVTDNLKELKELMYKVVEKGASHIVASILDIPIKIKDFIWEKIKKFFGESVLKKYRALYTEKIGNYLHAKIEYRRQIFSFLKEESQKLGVTFALCMEFYQKEGKIKGLNQEFMTSYNCDGMDVPVYIRENFKFKPAAKCRGNCLNCTTPLCGIKDLAMGREGSKKDWKLKDYLRWSRELSSPPLLR